MGSWLTCYSMETSVCLLIELSAKISVTCLEVDELRFKVPDIAFISALPTGNDAMVLFVSD